MVGMKRYLDDLIAKDLARKMVLVTGPRQVGKTTLCRHLMARLDPAQYLNWDVPGDRAILQRQGWLPRARLLALDEIHKMPDWKNWLKGVVDGRPPLQALLVTGSARMETWRQSGDSLAGRYLAYRLHPLSVREWCEQQGGTPAQALERILQRGGFPEPCLADSAEDAERWRRQYFTDLIREDVVEFSRLHEVNAMRLFVEMLRERVGSPLSLASLARDLAVAPNTLKRYLDILQALYIVFAVPPWHDNVARAILRAPKVYFFDTGLVRGTEGARFENAVAAMLLKHVHFRQDAKGKAAGLHYLRTKDGAEVDFAVAEDRQLTHLIECKLADNAVHRPLAAFAGRFPEAEALQLVRDLRQEELRGRLQIVDAARWLAGLDA
jgi:predicted AAA+ superfamily ATPase